MLLRTSGFLPNGDFTGTATVTVYACRQGTLDVTILGKTGDAVEARVDGVSVARLETPAERRGHAPDRGATVREWLTTLRLRAREPGLRGHDDDHVHPAVEPALGPTRAADRQAR